MTSFITPSGLVPSASVAPSGQPGPFDLRGRTLWPTRVFTRAWDGHAAEAPAIIEHLYELKSKEDRRIASGVAETSKSEEGLFESRMDLFEATDHPGLKKLHAFLIETVRQVVAGVNGGRVPPERIDVTFRDSWFHITNDGGFHDAHYHGGCSWCGIYYLRAGDVPREQPRHAGNGVNRFYSPIPVGGKYDDYGNAYLSQNLIDYPPRDGVTVVFPAYLQHSAIAYRGAEDRVVLAYNTTSEVRKG